MGASTAAKGGRGSDAGGYKESNRRRNEINPGVTKGATEFVKNKLGLTSVPNTPPPGVKRGDNDSDTSMVAMNLSGKDRFMYGREASAATDEYLRSIGELKGNMLSSKGKEIKYGQSNSAMGSGDPTGAMTSTPISKKMLQKQNKILGLTTAALSFAVPGIGGTIMRASAATNLINAKQSGAAYDDYTKKFDATQKGKKFTSQRNVTGVMALGLSKGKDKLGEVFGN